MNRKHGSILCGIALIAIAGCAPQARDEAAAPAVAVAEAPAPAAPVEPPPAAKAEAVVTTLTSPSDWTLVDGGGAELKTPAAAEITFNVAGGQLSGFGGCNQYNATIEIADSTVTIGPVAATKRGCPGDAGTAEQAYFAALGSVQGARVDGDVLLLQLADGSELRFARAATP